MQKLAASLDLRTTIGNYQFRFSNCFDQEAIDFENQKIKEQKNSKVTIKNGDNNEFEITWPQLSYWQSSRYFLNQTEPYYFLQMSNIKQNTHYQLVIRVETSSISHFKIGIIDKWAINPSKEELLDLNILIDRLQYYIQKHTGLMSIRVKPYMPGETSLQNIHSILRQRGFKDTSPTSYVKTRMINLLPSNEELLKSFSANGRARLKIKENDKEKIEIKEVRQNEYVPHLQNALNASFKRSANKNCPFDFAPLLKSDIKDVHMLGFFLKQEDAPKAFATGVYHQNIAEFSVGGSLEDPSLRQYPFNHLLLWNLALKAKAQGLELFDMGGISSGDDTDPLKGITKFKRLFPGFEIQTGNEMLKVIRPRTLALYSVLQKTARWVAT